MGKKGPSKGPRLVSRGAFARLGGMVAGMGLYWLRVALLCIDAIDNVMVCL